MATSTKPKATKTKLVFSAPRTRTREDLLVWPTRIAELAKHPDEWVDATATWGITHNNCAIVKRNYGSTLECVTSKVENGERHLFVKYVAS